MFLSWNFLCQTNISFKLNLLWFLRTRTKWSQILSQNSTQVYLSPRKNHFPLDPQDPGLHSLCSSWHSCLPSFYKDSLFPSALSSSALLTQSRTFSMFLLWTSSKNLRTTLPRLRQQLNFAATFFSIGHFFRCNQMLDQRKFRKEELIVSHKAWCSLSWG